MTFGRSVSRTAAAVLVMAMMASGLGCVGYAVYPPEEGMKGFKNPNSDPIPTLMTEAVKYVSSRYPSTSQEEWHAAPSIIPGEAPKFVVNLPSGVNQSVYRSVVKNISPTALPMEPGLEGLPTYHVARVYVQGDEAKVDVIRPVPALGGNASEARQITQGVTVRLRGGFGPWHVTSHNVWTLGAMPVPPINYVPER
jgi:hypothetical protein